MEKTKKTKKPVQKKRTITKKKTKNVKKDTQQKFHSDSPTTVKKEKNQYIPNAILGIWLLLFIFIGIAFAGHTSALGMDGTVKYQAHIYDYVYITRARISDSSNASSINYSFLDHELNATIMAPSCNGYVTYELDILNATPAKAYITKTNVVSMMNGSGNPSSAIDVEFLDVVENETFINPHSTKTIHVRMKNNCSGSDDQTRIKVDFEYSLYQYYDLTVNATPNDSSITITTSEGSTTGTGSLTVSVMETDTYSYQVTKNDYYQETGNGTMPSQNKIINVTLDKIIIINFNANGGSVNSTSKMVRKGQAIGEMPTPTKANATFIGWFEDVAPTYDNSKTYKTTPLYYYADTYGDLYNAFGYNEQSLYNHYLNNGIGEGRRISQYLASDVVNFDSNKTLYAGWVYTWGKYDKVKAWDETLTLANDESGGFVANTYFSYTERTNLYDIINMNDGKMHFTTGEKFSIGNTYPRPFEDYIYAANSDSLKTHSWTTSGHPEDVVSHFCIIKSTRVTLVGYVTCDIYEVSNVRWAKGDNLIERLYSSNETKYPDNNYSGDYWYLKE